MWVGIKGERAYLSGNADRQWRELATAVIRGQLAPGDVHSAFYWLSRLHRRAMRQEAAEARATAREAMEYAEREREREASGYYTERPGDSPGPDAYEWSPE